MSPPFCIVDGFVDLEAGVVVRPSGVVALSPAEVALLELLVEAAGEPVPRATLAEQLWILDGRTDRIEPLLWSLRRKLAPAADVLDVTNEGPVLTPVDGPVQVQAGFVALVGSEELAPPEGVRSAGAGLWVSDDVQRLVAALVALPPEVPLRAAVDAWQFVQDGGRTVALQAAAGRLRKLVALEERLVLTDAVIRGLALAVRPIGVWRRTPASEPEALWSVEAPAGVLAPVPSPSAGPVLTGREDEGETCWAAIRAGAATVLLHGPEGSGRTSLLETLVEHAPVRLGPQWHVRTLHLGGVLDAAGLVERLLRGLEVAARGRAHEAVARALASLDPLLLVVDDLDDAAPEIVQELVRWRQRAARCTLLATSRRPLRLPGALWVKLEPLAVPARRRLLYRRTRALPGWTDVPVDDPVMTALVEEVGGSPVALQALVGRARFMGPELLLAAVRMERVGASKEPGRAILDVAIRRVGGLAVRGLDRLVALARRLSLSDARAALSDLSADPMELLRSLVEAGLLHVVEDRKLLEAWFSVPRPVSELRSGRLPAEELEALHARVDASLARRAGAWADAMDAGGEDVRTARRIELLARAFEDALDRRGSDPRVAMALCRALLTPWERGHLPASVLLARLQAFEPEALWKASHALHRARLGCDCGRRDVLAHALPDAVQGTGPVGELGRLLQLDMDHAPGAEARSLRNQVVHELLSPRAERVSLLPEMLDYLLVSGGAADVVEIADQHASVASERGSRWRTAQLALQGFRARAGLGRLRPDDLRTARQHLAVLKEVRDHRRLAAGLQWLARALVAGGDPRGGLALLERSLPVIDAHGVWAVRHMARLDQARAHQLLGDVERSVAALQAFARLQEHGPKLPPIIGAFDRVLHAVGALDAEALHRAVSEVGAGSRSHHRYTAILAQLVDALEGRPATLPAPAVKIRGAAERLLAELVAAWRSQHVARIADACQQIRRTPEWSSIALVGVVLRAVEAAACRRLDLGGPAD